MNTVAIDLIGEKAVNIGASYSIKIKFCDAPDLTLYTGLCQIKAGAASPDIVLSPTINILSKDILEIAIAHDAFPNSTTAATYNYDILLTKTNHHFYPVAGRIQFVKRITVIA